MREIKIEEHKLIALDVLIEFDKVCRANNIKYSLAYGTLLGAVRHKGFIPWDDDIDVIVTRSDYVKLQEIFNERAKEKYKFICVENTEGFSAPLGKIIDTTTVLEQEGHNSDKIELGVYIDIFAYDWIPENEKKRNRILKKAERLQKLWSFCGNNYGNHSGIINLVRNTLNKTKLARVISLQINRWAMKTTHEKETMAALIFGAQERKKNVMAYVDFCDLIEYEFEGYNFLGVNSSDKYLIQWYGDYMQLPPVEQQVSNHNIKVYRKITNDKGI